MRLSARLTHQTSLPKGAPLSSLPPQGEYGAMALMCGRLAGGAWAILPSLARVLRLSGLVGGFALGNSADGGGEDLDRRIAETEAKHVPTSPSAEERAENQGWAMGVDFVGVVLISAFIGWAIDRWAGSAGIWTGPWAMIVFLMLGFAAGVRNVMRLAKSDTGLGGDAGAGAKPAKPALYDEDDD